MRYYGFLILAAFMALTVPRATCSTTFGSVLAIGGHASDIALDEARGLLYVSNYTTNCIDEVNTANNSLMQCQFNVDPQPGSLALSPDGQYLLIAHGPKGDQFKQSYNLLTLIHLPDGASWVFSTGDDTPLGVAFVATVAATGPANLSGPGMALIVTTNAILTLEPKSQTLSVVETFAALVGSLPVPIGTSPPTAPPYAPQILQTALTTSKDGLTVWGIADTGTQPELVFVYSARTGSVSGLSITAAPPLLPRVSVAADGSYAMVGYALLSAPAPLNTPLSPLLGTYPNIYPGMVLLGRYPNRTVSPNITGHAIDSKNNLIYAQIPDATQPAGPPYGPSNMPTMMLMDADNLTVRDRIVIPESMVGRAVLNAAATTMYVISDSGVMVLPVGSLNQNHRLAASKEDVLVQTSFCDRATASQSLTITDPGGGHTDFTISSPAGVTVVPAFGTTPATVQVLVDTAQFPAKGTTTVTLTINSASAINLPRTVRLLVNDPDVNQRGTIVDVPGVLTDILPDTARNKFYILRQDTNQVLVFDGNSNQQISAWRTATTPTKISFTIDQKYLLVGHNDSQLIEMYDLDAMQRVVSVVMPGGHFGLSIAQSNALFAVLARDEGTGFGVIESIDLTNHWATPLPTLGIWQNSLAGYLPGVLVPSPNGADILFADAAGQVALYSADRGTFTLGRQDFTSLSGAVAASSLNTFVIGNNVFNPSLVPQGTLDTTYGTTAGFFFFNGSPGGYRLTATSASGIGVIQNLPTLNANAVQPIPMTEAPLLPTPSNNFTRTLAPMTSAGTVIALTASGFSVLSANYPAATVPPKIASVENAADFSTAVAPGGLISVFGSQMSATSIATSQIPLPTALGQSCLTVNGTPIPLLFVSAGQVNAQLPLNVGGNATMAIHTPAGISNNFNFVVDSAAPAIFLTGTAGPETGLATIFRADNGQLVTPTNPLHAGDTVIIYLTGMGATNPAVAVGTQTPVDLLTSVTQAPAVTVGSANLSVLYAGLAPGYISGLYQINATVPGGVTPGDSVPLVISQGGGSTTLSVRVVK